MVNLEGDAATRFDVLVELLELFEDIDMADAIDASVYIIEGASANVAALEYAEHKAAQPDAYDDDRYATDWVNELIAERNAAIAAHPSSRRFTADDYYRSLAAEDDELDAVLQSKHDAAKAAHPSSREPALEQDPNWLRGLGYDKLAATLAEGYQDDEVES